MTYHIVAATTNPAKIQAITQAFSDIFGAEQCRIEGVDIDSGVSAQPTSNHETRTGARLRVMSARLVRPEADFWVGIEAGIEDEMTFAWIAIENLYLRGESRSASLMLPECILKNIRQGNELGNVMAELTGISNIKQRGGAIGVFTAEKLSRSSVYHQAIILALSPFHQPLYTQ